MKNKLSILSLILLSIFLLLGCSNQDDKNEKALVLYINEILSKSDFTDDWVEIYNPNDQQVDIGGFYIYDSGTAENKYQLPQGTTIDAKGFLIIWCDDENTGLHTNFKLSSDGDEIGLENANGKEIDHKEFGAITPESSLGRNPDGSDNWVEFNPPTPGISNTETPNTPPQISNIAIAPQVPTPADSVWVLAHVLDVDGTVESVESVILHYFAGSDTQHINMLPNINSEQHMYSGVIRAYSEGITVHYYITAEDDEGAVSQSDTFSYTVQEGEFVPVPGLYINEFMADNDTTYADESGEYDDWIEIFNAYDTPMDIGGLYITDDLADPTKWQIPTTHAELTTIPAGGFLILWADEDIEQGVLHVDLKLSANGESIGLFQPDGSTVIDSIIFGAQTTDVSYGRIPDGSNNWQFMPNSSPGISNGE